MDGQEGCANHRKWESSTPSCLARRQCRFLRWRRAPPRPFPRCCVAAAFSRRSTRSVPCSARSALVSGSASTSFSAFRHANQLSSRKRRHSHPPGFLVSRIAGSRLCRPPATYAFGEMLCRLFREELDPALGRVSRARFSPKNLRLRKIAGQKREGAIEGITELLETIPRNRSLRCSASRRASGDATRFGHVRVSAGTPTRCVAAATVDKFHRCPSWSALSAGNHRSQPRRQEAPGRRPGEMIREASGKREGRPVLSSPGVPPKAERSMPEGVDLSAARPPEPRSCCTAHV
jgi:hypothetical protein